MRVFVDTSALYAVLDRDDQNHHEAAESWRQMIEGGDLLVVTNYILVETTALVQNRLGLEAVRTLADSVEPVLSVEWVSPEDHDAARAAVITANRRELSLVDCTSFVLMRRSGLRHAFTFDRHFSEQGFDVLPR